MRQPQVVEVGAKKQAAQSGHERGGPDRGKHNANDGRKAKSAAKHNETGTDDEERGGELPKRTRGLHR
jgi:hypothetical protein